MKIEQKTIDRLEELIKRGEEISKSLKTYPGEAFSFDHQAARQWKINCLSFLDTIFGVENIYSKELKIHFKLNSFNSLVSFGEYMSP